MDLLADRKNDDQPIFRAHVERTLKTHVREIRKAQDPTYSNFKTTAFRRRAFTVDGEALIYRHSALHRFVDMKKLRPPGGYKKNSPKYKRKEVYDVHNRIIMGHYNGIMKDLIYGAGEDVVQEMRRTFRDKEI